MAGGGVADEPVLTSGDPTGTEHGGFDAFYRVSFSRAARLAYLLTSDTDASEDIAQEAMARLQPRFDSIERPVAYLRTVVVNLSRRHGTDLARQRAAMVQLGVPSAQGPEGEELFDVIERLPRRQREVVVLRYFEDLTEAEIAAVLKCRPGTVKSLATRALSRLRKELDS